MRLDRKALLSKRFAEIAPLVPKALIHLHNVTGKWGILDIHPLEEKRWTNKCWDSLKILQEVGDIIVQGQTHDEVTTAVLKEMRPEEGWIGNVETQNWSFTEEQLGSDKFKFNPENNKGGNHAGPKGSTP